MGIPSPPRVSCRVRAVGSIYDAAVADFGLAGFPARPDGVDRMSHYRDVLESLPPAFSTVWISDHFQFGDRSTAEGWTLLTYLAASFPRFRYGHLVLGQSFRNPALPAKMAATLTRPRTTGPGTTSTARTASRGRILRFRS